MKEKEQATNKQVTKEDNSLQGKKIVVSGVDIKEETIIEYDRKGATLVFDTTGDTFPSLSEETLGKMSKWNVDRYRISREVWEELHKKDPLREVLDGIEFGTNRGSAMERLSIQNKNKEFVYWWERPERVYDKMAKGWEVVSGGPEKTIHSDGSRIHRIGKKGEEESILMRIPRRLWAKQEKEKVERYRRSTKGLGTATASSIGADSSAFIEDEQLDKLVASGKVRFAPAQIEGTKEEEEETS